MTREEAKHILAGYVKACQEDDTFTLVSNFSYKEVLEAMLMGADALSKPSLPSDVGEAADIHEAYYDVGEEHGYLYCLKGDIKNAFKAGAEWQKSKMLKDAVEAYIVKSYNPCTENSERSLHGIELLYEDKNKPYLLAGDKVRIVILKAEEE